MAKYGFLIVFIIRTSEEGNEYEKKENNMLEFMNIRIGTIEIETKAPVTQGYAIFVTLLILQKEHHTLPTGLKWKRHRMK